MFPLVCFEGEQAGGSLEARETRDRRRGAGMDVSVIGVTERGGERRARLLLGGSFPGGAEASGVTTYRAALGAARARSGGCRSLFWPSPNCS